MILFSVITTNTLEYKTVFGSRELKTWNSGTADCYYRTRTFHSPCHLSLTLTPNMPQMHHHHPRRHNLHHSNSKALCKCRFVPFFLRAWPTSSSSSFRLWLSHSSRCFSFCYFESSCFSFSHSNFLYPFLFLIKRMASSSGNPSYS